MTALRAAYDSLKDRWPGSFDSFLEQSKDWECHPVIVDGETVGALMVRGPEIHACIASRFGRWLRKQHFEVLNAVIEKHGYAQTHATTEAGERFVRRLGFEPHGNAFRRYAKWEWNRC